MAEPEKSITERVLEYNQYADRAIALVDQMGPAFQRIRQYIFGLPIGSDQERNQAREAVAVALVSALFTRDHPEIAPDNPATIYGLIKTLQQKDGVSIPTDLPNWEVNSSKDILNFEPGIIVGTRNRGKSDVDVATSLLDGWRKEVYKFAGGFTAYRNIDDGRPEIQGLAAIPPQEAAIECGIRKLQDPGLQRESCTQALRQQRL